MTHAFKSTKLSYKWTLGNPSQNIRRAEFGHAAILILKSLQYRKRKSQKMNSVQTRIYLNPKKGEAINGHIFSCLVLIKDR